MSLYSEEGGEGADLIVLLHGLGATGAVWTPLLERVRTRWRGRWFVPDLPGHGRSAPSQGYSLEESTAEIAAALLSRVERSGRLVILGHSLGGSIGLALASGRFGVQPSTVCGAGIKLIWSDEDLQRMRNLAAQPPKQFAAAADAGARYLKVSGLAGLVDVGSPVAARGIVSVGESWQLAMEPRANATGKPAFSDLIAGARCPVHLACGARDPLVTLEQTRALDPQAVDLGPYGHSVMVEAPQAFWSWAETHIG
jgi:pimeloyl-ACP methyl ester carboxylesterase